MKRLIIIILVTLISRCLSYAQIDTLDICTHYTTHVIFSTDLTYADLSNNKTVAARIIEQNKNMLALKARCEFEEFTSVSALESNGKMHTFIVRYVPSPQELVIDTRQEQMPQQTYSESQVTSTVSTHRKMDAPQLSEMITEKQQLFHIGDRRYNIKVLCENIVCYSDITYMVLSIKNSSNVSYDINDATFVIESKKKGKRIVVFEKTVFPEGRHGTLNCPAGSKTKIAYSFKKMTLSKDQVLKIYFYENEGQRNLEITVNTNDINKAGKSL